MTSSQTREEICEISSSTISLPSNATRDFSRVKVGQQLVITMNLWMAMDRIETGSACFKNETQFGQDAPYQYMPRMNFQLPLHTQTHLGRDDPHPTRIDPI
ncbi:hypothetical protein ACOSP7_009307 [Xanthoceras sorbifolium]